MKSKAFSKKLVLNKKTIADLTVGKMMIVHGGMDKPDIYIEETDRCPGATATSCNCTGPTGYYYCPACPIC